MLNKPLRFRPILIWLICPIETFDKSKKSVLISDPHLRRVNLSIIDQSGISSVVKPRKRRRLHRPSDQLWKTVDEAADHVGTCASTLNKKRGDGSGPKFIKRFGRIFYRMEWLDAWLEAGVRTSTSDGHQATPTPRNTKTEVKPRG